MPKTLTDKGVAALKPRAHRYHESDPELRRHYVRVHPNGLKTFWAAPRNRAGKQEWTKTGDADVVGIVEARKRARVIIERIQAGLPAEEQVADSFADVAANWMKRHVDAKGLRTAPEMKRLLDKFILPAWADRPFVGIKRSDVAKLLDAVQDSNGPRQADTVLDVVRAIMFWYSTRHDEYNPVVVRGMRRQSTKEQARTRILSDDEIRKVWAKATGTFGAIVRIALLTAQRRDKVVTMKWDDIKSGVFSGDLMPTKVWTIPTDAREKGNIGAVALPRMVLDIIEAQPRLASNPYVFSGRGAGAYKSLSKPKRRLDKASGVTGWTIHDCRRTARSLLSRAGVSSEHAEKVMGHTIPGVEGTYDRHTYDKEKADALNRLATLVDGIVHPDGRANVVPMKKKAKR
jgi:integrase